jgi:hypothetical protein
MEHEGSRFLATIAKRAAAALAAVTLDCWATAAAAQSAYPLPSWKDGQAKQAVVGALLGSAKGASAAEPNPVTAIDILLEPDEKMIEKATAANERLLKEFPNGFAFDETHAPHISVLQRYVETGDLDKVYEAVGRVLAGENPASWRLTAYKYFYVVWDDLGLAGTLIEPTDDLIRYQQKLIEAVAPFTVETGTAAAFVTTRNDPAINQPTIDYVAHYVPDASGEKFKPHVTIGVAPPEYLNKMLDEKFEAFTFSLAGAAVYHLGNFGTAREELKNWKLKP